MFLVVYFAFLVSFARWVLDLYVLMIGTFLRYASKTQGLGAGRPRHSRHVRCRRSGLSSLRGKCWRSAGFAILQRLQVFVVIGSRRCSPLEVWPLAGSAGGSK